MRDESVDAVRLIGAVDTLELLEPSGCVALKGVHAMRNIQKISEFTRMSEREIGTALDVLLDRGVLACEKRGTYSMTFVVNPDFMMTYDALALENLNPRAKDLRRIRYDEAEGKPLLMMRKREPI